MSASEENNKIQKPNSKKKKKKFRKYEKKTKKNRGVERNFSLMKLLLYPAAISVQLLGSNSCCFKYLLRLFALTLHLLWHMYVCFSTQFISPNEFRADCQAIDGLI